MAAAATSYTTITTADEFLAWAAAQLGKYEFDRGTIVAMSGGTRRHSRLAVRLMARLEAALEGSACDVVDDDYGVKLANGDAFRPDVLVACGGFEDYATTEPLIVMEVLSPSTEAMWRGRLPRLQAVPALRHIVFVHPDVMRVEHRARASGWAMHELTAAEEFLSLPEIDVALSLGELYRGILPAV